MYEVLEHENTIGQEAFNLFRNTHSILQHLIIFLCSFVFFLMNPESLQIFFEVYSLGSDQSRGRGSKNKKI